MSSPRIQQASATLGAILIICALTGVARAQFATVINVPPNAAVSKIVFNTQLNLFNGGALPDYFEAGVSNVTSANLELNVYGGGIGANMTTHPGTALNVSGGLIGQWYTAEGSDIHISGGRIVNNFRSVDSTINMNAGQIDAIFNLEGTSVLNMTGGSIGADFRLRPGATVNLSGGSLGTLAADPNTTVNISGGTVGRANIDGNVNISGGTFAPSFVANSTSHVEIMGGEFRLNGNLIGGLDAPGNSVAFNLSVGNTLSGILVDGTPVAFSSWNDDSFSAGVLRLKAGALPAIGPPEIVASVGPVPLGIRQGQTLVVDRGAVVRANFNAGRGSTVNVHAGGAIGSNLEAVTAVVNVSGGTTGNVKVYVGGTLNLTGGSVAGVLADRNSVVNIWGGATGFVDLINGSTLTLTDGAVSGLNAQNGGIVKMSGGTIGSPFRAFGGSNVTVTGGQVGSDLTCNSGSVVSVSGGSIGDRFTAASGSLVSISGASFGDTFKNSAGSATRLSGGDFRLNGMGIRAASAVGSTTVFTLAVGDILSGAFTDGTPFAFSSADSDALGTVTLVTSQLPIVGASLIDLPASPAPRGIRGGQTLNVHNGGQLPTNFNAGAGSAVHVFNGATVGKNFEVIGGTVEIAGGNVGENFDAFFGSTVNIRGGSIGANFSAHNGSIVNIRGGTLGAAFQAFAGSMVNLLGKEFLLNGTPVVGLTMGQQLLLTTRTGTLSGRFTDGSAFSLPLQVLTRDGILPLFSPNAQITLTLVPEPVSAWICVGGLLFIGGTARRLREVAKGRPFGAVSAGCEIFARSARTSIRCLATSMAKSPDRPICSDRADLSIDAIRFLTALENPASTKVNPPGLPPKWSRFRVAAALSYCANAVIFLPSSQRQIQSPMAHRFFWRRACRL